MVDSTQSTTKRQLVSSDGGTLPRWKHWIIPTLSLIQAIFVGSTFMTLPTTIMSALSAGLVVGFLLLWLGGQELHRSESATRNDTFGKAPQNRSASRATESMTRDQAKEILFRLKRWRPLMLVPVLLVVVAVGLAFRVGHHMAGNLNPVAMVVDSTAHVMFFVSLTLWVFYPRTGHPGMLACGLLLVLTTVTAGGVSHTINGQLVAALATVIAFSLSADHILGQWQVHRRHKTKRRKSAKRRRGNVTGVAAGHPLPKSTVSLPADQGRTALLVSVLTLSVLLMATSAAGHLTSTFVPAMQLTIFDRLTQSLEAVTNNTFIGGTRYVRGSRLGTVRQHMVGDPAEPALRAYSATEPGYLRGTIFDTYSTGTWSSAAERPGARSSVPDVMRPRPIEVSGPGTTKLNEAGELLLNRIEFRNNPNANLLGRVEVHNYPYKGNVVFTALSTDWIEAATQGVTVSHHDSILGGVDVHEPYVLGIMSENPQEVLEDARKIGMLSLSAELRARIGPLAESVCDSRLTAESKARAIEDYFQNNFVYSLQPTPSPSGADPVLHFLETQHPAHCEFFASAAALMLRCVGVPTRYVTGYVVTELTDDGDYFLARNRDAHAWVEAYDEISQRWFPVEATVGRSYQSLRTAQQSTVGATGAVEDLLDMEDDRSFFGRALGWLLSFRASDSLTFVFRIAQLPLFCFVVVLLWIRSRQKRAAGGDSSDWQSRQMLGRVDRRVRKFNLIRTPDETLHQFARRVEQLASTESMQDPFLRSAADWYRRFAEDRYRGRAPTPMEGTGAP